MIFIVIVVIIIVIIIVIILFAIIIIIIIIIVRPTWPTNIHRNKLVSKICIQEHHQPSLDFLNHGPVFR